MKNTKKGFTLVELLIVIAIIAILATVSVVGYVGFINKANLSNDQQTISMINKNLQAEFATGKPASAGEAISALAALGFTGDKLNAYTEGYHYVYNSDDNLFYLLDSDGKVVFPEECSKDNLWGLYGNYDSDYIDGITNYVATTSITNADYFRVFNTETSYKIDLNQNVVMVENANANITFINGYTIIYSYKSDDNNIKLVEKYESEDNKVTGDIIQNKVIVLSETPLITNGDVTIENCVFIDTDVGEKYVNSNITPQVGSTLTIRNCSFTNSGAKYALTIYNTSDVNIIIENNEFVNCNRGINFGYFSGNVVIDGNKFNLKQSDDRKNNCIQIADTSAAFEIKNNNFASATSAIIVHSNYIAGTHAPYASTITFENNTLGENVEKVIADPTYKTDLNETQQKAMEDAVAEFKKNFK